MFFLHSGLQQEKEEGERERRRWSLRETERTNKNQKEEKGGRLSVLSSKVERNLIERLD